MGRARSYAAAACLLSPAVAAITPMRPRSNRSSHIIALLKPGERIREKLQRARNSPSRWRPRQARTWPGHGSPVSGRLPSVRDSWKDRTAPAAISWSRASFPM